MWRVCAFVSDVWPVAIRSAEFCTVWSVLMCVSAIVGPHMVLQYSMIGRVMVLYVCSMVSLFFPQEVPVRALSMLRVFWDFL